MACQAQPRERRNDPHWVCDGTGLVIILRSSGGIPIVCPAERVAEATAEYPDAWKVEEFTGGDHLHVVLPPASG